MERGKTHSAGSTFSADTLSASSPRYVQSAAWVSVQTSVQHRSVCLSNPSLHVERGQASSIKIEVPLHHRCESTSHYPEQLMLLIEAAESMLSINLPSQGKVIGPLDMLSLLRCGTLMNEVFGQSSTLQLLVCCCCPTRRCLGNNHDYLRLHALARTPDSKRAFGIDRPEIWHLDDCLCCVDFSEMMTDICAHSDATTGRLERSVCLERPS